MLNDPPEIEGWLSDAQGRSLQQAAAATTGRGAIVEIGSWKGRSTAWLATGAMSAGRRVHAVDPHQGSKEDPGAHTLPDFLANLRRAGVLDAVEPMVMTSGEAAAVLQGPIELLFIDGDHSPDAVARDASLWLPRVTEHGRVMFHDVASSGYTGPRRVFQRSICWSARFDTIAFVGSMGIARRTAQRSTASAIWGTIVGVLLFGYDVEAVLKRWLRAISRRSSAARASRSAVE